MAEDNIPIVPALTQPTTPVTLIKTFSAIDANGKLVEIQAIVPTDSLGRVQEQPLTEATGRQILSALISINNLLHEDNGCGVRLDDNVV